MLILMCFHNAGVAAFIVVLLKVSLKIVIAFSHMGLNYAVSTSIASLPAIKHM